MSRFFNVVSFVAPSLLNSFVVMWVIVSLCVSVFWHVCFVGSSVEQFVI